MKRGISFYRLLFCIITTAVIPFSLSAQSLIKGKVTDTITKQPIAGVNVVLKNSKRGSSTKEDGEFSISPREGAELLVSNTGYETSTIKIEGGCLRIEALPLSQQLNTVVVTVLSVRKETKKPGCSVQEVKGADLVKAREPKLVNCLAGKVSGLTAGASAEILQGTQLILRGRGINLFVADGVPVNSGTWNISPDDPVNIESNAVLKGAQLIPQYDSLVDPITGARQATTWIARGKDNLQRFLEPCLLATDNLAVSSKTDTHDFYYGHQRYDRTGIHNGWNYSTLNNISRMETEAKKTGTEDVNPYMWRIQ